MPPRRLMPILTSREKEIMRLLKAGKSVQAIADELEAPHSSVSGSITRIRFKLKDFKETLDFLQKIGFASVEKGEIRFLSPEMDIKVLRDAE